MRNDENVSGTSWFQAFDAWGDAIARDNDQDATDRHNRLIEITCRLANHRSRHDADILAKLEVWVQDNIDTCDELYEQQVSNVLILSVIRDLLAREETKLLRPHTLMLLESMSERIRSRSIVELDSNIDHQFSTKQHLKIAAR